MSSGNYRDNNSKNGSRRSPALVLLLLIFVLAAFFLLSDISFVKNARDSAFRRLGYVTEDSSGESGADTAESGQQYEAEDSPEGTGKSSEGSVSIDKTAGIDASSLPEYNGDYYIEVNGNVPDFPDAVYDKASIDKGKAVPYEYYGKLDKLGRCTGAFGCLGPETMPANGEERGDISSVHPSGWAKGQGWERSHLIAWALSAENANPCNLITGTHYLNYDAMRPVEEKVEHYIWDTGNHVLYLSKPWFRGKELVPRGVQMTAKSVEDGGKGISFNIYCFNVTPNAEINYDTGVVSTEEQANQSARKYILNKRSGVFHYPSCDGAKSISSKNREEVDATRSELVAKGYKPCGSCEP